MTEEKLFLITEEQLNRACDQMTAGGYGVSANYIDTMVRSRPYNPQAGREKVLDELDKKIMQRTDELLNEFNDECCDRYIWERRLGVWEVLDMIEELRGES